MTKKGSIKTWIIFTILILGLLALFYFLTKDKNGGEGSDQPEKTSKPFAVQELSEAEKKELDQENVSRAIEAGSIEACEELFNEALKQKCLDSINYDSILDEGNERSCEKLSDPDLKRECYDQIYYEAALDNNDISLCGKIQDQSRQSDCMGRLQVKIAKKAKNS